MSVTVGTMAEIGAQTGDVLEFVSCKIGCYNDVIGWEYIVAEHGGVYPKHCPNSKSRSFGRSNQHIFRLVSRAAPTGPVRTVTRKEIVPGEYPGRVFVTNSLDVFMGAHRRDAAELRAAIATLTEIADALEAPTQ